LSSLQRKAIGALITIDVHSRDVLDNLIKDNITTPTSFGWSKQLRYYYDETDREVVLRQSNATFTYRCEYLGASMRLVITPLTDR
ncbi:dynein heavy chain, partial [Kipferlia bialata]